MRLAIFSDVHGNLAALEAVLEDIARRGVDATVGLGDFLSGPFDPLGVADRVMAESIPGVRGNHDRWIFDGRDEGDDWAIDAMVRDTIGPARMDWLRSLPLSRVVEDVFLCHGTPASDTAMWMDQFTEVETVVSSSREWIEEAAVGVDHPVLCCGHTHVPRLLRLADGRLVVNPGSVGLPFLLGSPDARYAIVERRNGQWSAELIAIPYDVGRAQKQALAQGYPGFAKAVQTGWAKLSEL